MTIVMIAGLASVEALVLTNHRAATMRTMNNARAIVQRNIDTALGVPFSANAAPPAILAVGSADYDDDGDGVLDVPVVVKRDGTTNIVSGRLLRTVTAESNPAGADIRRVTFQLTYYYRRTQPYIVSMTTLRSTD